MKKILLLCGFAVSFLASEAQTKTHKKKAKKTKMSTEAIVKARLDSIEIHRQLTIDSVVAYQKTYDSTRLENERVAFEKFQQDQAAWKETKEKEMDSSNRAQWTTLSKDHDHWVKVQKERDALNKAAKLNAYQDRQVNFINQSTFEKAKKITVDSSLNEDDKKQQLAKLNEERRDKIKTVVGKSKERKLEKARKSNPATEDTEAKWISEIDGFVKN